MTTNNSNTKKEKISPSSPSIVYYGTPEGYMVVPEDGEIDTDALNCTLGRARSVCLMLGKNFDGTSDRFNDEIISDACWALEGIINQAQMLIKGEI